MALTLYVRRCTVCAALDTHSAYGRPDLVDPDRTWTCRSCPSTAWCLARLDEAGR